MRETSEFRGIYERYASVVHARCRHILKSDDDAWDAVQEVFMKLHRSLPDIRDKGSIYYWLMSASTNYCISALRKRKHEEFDEEIHSRSPSDSASSSSGVIRADYAAPQERELARRRIVGKYFLPWDKKVREVVWYVCVDGYTNAEAAQMAGIGESTVRKYITEFRKKNTDMMRKIGNEL